MTKHSMPTTETEWKQKLTPQQYRVLRQKGTEIPGTSDLLDVHDDGSFTCAGCGEVLFTSEDKFDSGTGWPSFDKANGNVKLIEDNSHGMVRTEVVCAHCDGHLGHVFDDGPTKTGQRFCINGCALSFKPKQ